MAETAAQKKARLAKQNNVIPAFNPNTVFQTDKFDNPNFTGWATYKAASGYRVAVWRKNGKIDPQNKGDAYYVLKNGNWYNTVNNKAIKATGPVTDSGVAPLTGQSWNEIGFNEGVAPLTGKSWQQIDDEKAAAAAAGSNPVFGDPNASPVGIPKGTPTGTPTIYTAPDGKIFTDLDAYNTYIKTTKGQSAYDLLFDRFNEFGMGALVEPLKGFIQQGLSSSEFTLRLRDTDAYKKRFAANAQRAAKGLAVLNEAEYIGLEDQYQNIMREYGLPASYYARGDMGRQEGFEKFLANDVSSAELEDRILTAQSRVTNANPEVRAALKQFYPGIGDGDILAYTLDPEKALTDIKRKITAAEIGGAAMQAGLNTGMARAEELGAAGVNKQQAREGFQAVAEIAPRGGMLADIYKQSPYTQATAESEVFGLAGSSEAARQRKKLTSLETAAFSGRSGTGAIARDRAGTL